MLEENKDEMTSKKAIKSLCRKLGAEGCVLLNNDGVLPLNKKPFALFGRCQIDPFYIGYGSGGDVKPPYKVSILEGLKSQGARLDQEVRETYEKWTKKHVLDKGTDWNWPYFYEEMPLDDEFVASAAKRCKIAVVIIGRAAGEEMDNKAQKGSWYLTDQEENMLRLTRKYFKKVCVLLNCGSIMDIDGILKYQPNALMYVWQLGQEMGNAVGDVLLGKVSPSGRLTDTIAKIEDYPSNDNFGNLEFNEYCEDIYVGYRYFNTFKEDKIIYPFGYGLSYSKFEVFYYLIINKNSTFIDITFKIRNAGKYKAKDVIQFYLSAPQGKLGKPKRELVGYVKTKELKSGEAQTISLAIDLNQFASYDDTGITGYKSSFVLESGEYKIFVGENASKVKEIYSFTLNKTKLVKTCEEACAPKEAFKRMVNKGELAYEYTPVSSVDLKKRIKKRLPKAIVSSEPKSYKLQDVKEGTISLDEFVASLSLEELEEITRGSLYMMDSPYGPKGNAGTCGASSPSLFNKGVPALSTNDGPSGVRLQALSTLLPNAVCLASTFDDELIERLAYEFGREAIERKSHIVLAPGMNIHRHPLCGRNFEYFSEDPFLSGKIAASIVRGIQKAGASATPKHFACNNQEYGRLYNDSRVSERALREIYLKGFEICIKEARPDCLMTSYNKLNGVYNYYNYELVTTILRDEWGYEGVVMTDWWMQEGKSDIFRALETQAYRIRAQVDIFMPGAPHSGKYQGKSDGTIIKSIKGKGGLTLGELQQCAKRVLQICLKHM